MAKPSSWIPHVETFVDASRPSNQQAASLEAIAALVKKDLLTMEAVVREMEMYLTTSDHILRARGILLLAELLTRLVSKPLDSATIHSLTGFFTSRLADWQALHGALVGCLALLRRSTNVGMVTVTDAKMLMKSYLQNLQVQSLALHDRKMCFELLECLLEHYADAVAPLGDDLVYGICEAIDEEKDPQCLLLTFHIVEVLVRVFHDPLGSISSFAGDLFDILSRYFPIYFTHPKNDDLDVKRDDLSRALMHAFASTPLFEPFVIPLLLDKLSSSLLSAKLDSLKYLSYCTLHYGADRIAKHSKAIWSSLKEAICTFSPQDTSFLLAFESPKDMRSQENKVAAEALVCLERIMVQLDSSSGYSFINFIVEDEDIEMIFRSVTGVLGYKDLTAEVKGLQTLATFPGSSMPISKAICEKVLTMFVSIITGRCEEELLWKLALKALIQIGTFIESSYDTEKRTSYMNIIVGETFSLLSLDDSGMPLPLKLEALNGIGTTGLDYMMRLIQGLEEAISANFVKAAVEGNVKSMEILIYLLEYYSGQVLPWLKKTVGFEEVALRFAVNIWDQLESSKALNIGIQGQGLLDAIMTATRLAVGDCTAESQALIVQKSYCMLSSMTFFPLKESVPLAPIKLESLKLIQDIVSLSSRDEWLISLFSSILTALHPQTPIPEVREILKLLTIFVLKGYVPAAQALGSIINKCPLKINTIETSSVCTLEEALDIIQKTGLYGVLSKDPLSNGTDGSCENVSNLFCVASSKRLFQIHAIVGLAWIGKGLVMRGHEKVTEIAILLLKCLLSSSSKEILPLQQNALENGNGPDIDPSVVRSAADAFHILLSDSEVCLNKKFHATIRPLYKQHFFSSMIPILLSSIKDADSSVARASLYQAFGHLISDAPLAAIVTEAQKLLQPLMNAICILSLDNLNKDLTYSLLLVLSGILMDENGKEAVTENAHSIITNLLTLISYPHMMVVRETAIQCLVAMTGLPYVRIYPMRTQVLQAMTKALDDRKRSVRQEAIRCRQAWASIASRSLHF
eukprot:TRINITY_DN28778_c0_g1_i1.p1 TRINITY_DN28778_c0_g1~~TRINITY_DN28778_c0_g1_i1.p1  ORF type:complete len:1030 (-),score=201.51 TRINITY_DN28778_c0_g1_i1:623-3712(-)